MPPCVDQDAECPSTTVEPLSCVHGGQCAGSLLSPSGLWVTPSGLFESRVRGTGRFVKLSSVFFGHQILVADTVFTVSSPDTRQAAALHFRAPCALSLCLTSARAPSPFGHRWIATLCSDLGCQVLVKSVLGGEQLSHAVRLAQIIYGGARGCLSPHAQTIADFMLHPQSCELWVGTLKSFEICAAVLKATLEHNALARRCFNRICVLSSQHQTLFLSNGGFCLILLLCKIGKGALAVRCGTL